MRSRSICLLVCISCRLGIFCFCLLFRVRLFLFRLRAIFSPRFLYIVSLFLLSIFYQLVFHEDYNKIFIENLYTKMVVEVCMMFERISKRKIPKVLDYLSEVRKVLKEAMDRVECLLRQMFVDTGVSMSEVEHVLFLFSLALEDLRRMKEELELKLKGNVGVKVRRDNKFFERGNA